MRIRILMAILAGVLASSANATLIFSDVDVQSDSIAFTVDGDMTGYTAPGGWLGNLYNFNLRYTGDLWAGGNAAVANVWSNEVFDGLSLSNDGNTGMFSTSVAYTWSEYATASLANATATNRQVTLSWGSDVLNTASSNGAVEFYWGWANPNSDGFTLLATVTPGAAAVPEPSTLLLFGLGLVGFGWARRK